MATRPVEMNDARAEYPIAPMHHEDVPMNIPKETMHRKDGSMRVMPGWTTVSRYDEKTGEVMPFARKHSVLQRDATQPGVFWSRLDCNSKQLLLFEDELKSGKSRRGGHITSNGQRFGPDVRYSVDTLLLSKEGNAYNANLVIGLEILKPLFKVYKVKRVEVELVDRSKAPAIIRDNPKRKNHYYFGCCDFSKDTAAMVRAQDPSAELVSLTTADDQAGTKDGARFAYREFVENAYCTTSKRRFTDSELKETPADIRLFNYQGKQYIWKLSSDFQDVSIYEAWMAQRIRRYSSPLISDANDNACEDIDDEDA